MLAQLMDHCTDAMHSTSCWWGKRNHMPRFPVFFLISRCHCSLEDKIQDVLNIIFQTIRKCEREQTLTPRPGDPGIPERPSWPGKPGNPRSPLTPSLPGRPGVAWMEKNKTKTLLIMMLKCNFETLKICRSKGSNTVHLWRFLFFPVPLL